jgi:hypothetical protein
MHLAELFKKSQYSHYYAVSFYYHFIIFRKNERKVSSEAMTSKTDELILAVISIFPEHELLQSEGSRAKIVALITSSNVLPSKQQLMNNIQEMGLLAKASPPVLRLWEFLKEGFSLHSLPAMRNDFDSLNRLVDGGTAMLEKNIVIKILENVGQVYRNIRLSRLFEMVPFAKQRVL